MARTRGAKNKDHDGARIELVRAVTPLILAGGGKPQSLKDLADAAAVDPATLRHYFGDRRGVVRAVFLDLLPIGEMRKAMAMSLLVDPPRVAFSTLLAQIAEGWSILGNLHALGFAEGFADSDLGERYISDIFEPTLATFEAMIAHYQQQGALRACDTRTAGLALLSPVLLALFHQHQLSGVKCRPLDVPSFLTAHLELFLRGMEPS